MTISIDYVALDKAITTLGALVPRVRAAADQHQEDLKRAVTADFSSGSASGQVSPMFTAPMDAANTGITRWGDSMRAQADEIERIRTALVEWRDASRAADEKAKADADNTDPEKK